MHDRSGEGWYGDLFGTVPVQGWGRVDGHPWYFRARGACWSMEIVQDQSLDEEKLPVVGFENAGWEVDRDYGEWPEAGYMPNDIAWGFIEETIAGFRAGRLPFIPAGSRKER